MKTWIISDTHTLHRKLIIPDGLDTVIHCGDCSNSHDPALNVKEVQDFIEWYKNIPVKNKIYVPGNHDTSIQAGLINKNLFKDNGIHILIHEQLNLEGVNCFGSPYTPRYGEWAYMYKRQRGKEYWDTIPNNTDILITHGPPKYHLDLSDDENDRKKIAQVGCKNLLNAIETKNISFHCFGHIHSTDRFNNYGILIKKNKMFVNASCVNLQTQEFYHGHLVNL